jgi:hypothetical protein
MLPILRTISVGGVLLAITILALALSPPGGTHMRLASPELPARGALQEQSDHPEWRHFLILAAVRRAEELNYLRELADKPAALPEIPFVAPDYVPAELAFDNLTPSNKDAVRTAGLPAARSDAELEDETGSIEAVSSATIPIEIGERSSTELPVSPVEERPPVIRAPLSVTPSRDAPSLDGAAAHERPAASKSVITRTISVKPRQRSVAHTRTKTAAPTQTQTEAPPPFNLLQALFESFMSKAANQPAAPAPKARPKAKRTATIRGSAG